MMVSAAVVDDVLGLAILGVIVSFITTSERYEPIEHNNGNFNCSEVKACDYSICWHDSAKDSQFHFRGVRKQRLRLRRQLHDLAPQLWQQFSDYHLLWVLLRLGRQLRVPRLSKKSVITLKKYALFFRLFSSPRRAQPLT